MKLKTETVSWISDLANFLFNESETAIGPIKKILRQADFDKLSYADRVALHKMFDPNAEISEMSFNKHVDLYFNLLESKTETRQIPVFSEYVEWLYTQDLSKMPIGMFEKLISKAEKLSLEGFPEDVRNIFDLNVLKQLDTNVDTLSNRRLSALVNLVASSGLEFDQMPREYKNFILRMYARCAVKTEISDRNQHVFRGLFKNGHVEMYNRFNKAFAGVDEYETWIDSPAKKLTFPNLKNYANYQREFLSRFDPNCSSVYYTGRRSADYLGLPKIPNVEDYSILNPSYYLREPREYKTYAKRMAPLFEKMICDVVKCEGEKSVDDNSSAFNKMAFTNEMRSKLSEIKSLDDIDRYQELADYLIDLVHLDELLDKDRALIVGFDTTSEYEKLLREGSSSELLDLYSQIQNQQKGISQNGGGEQVPQQLRFSEKVLSDISDAVLNAEDREKND